ncbi:MULTISPECIES: urea amidolyase associated protein UAAP1 [Micrococcaceae]|uniref:urea amidolyase associated protein UAAP1 n=1 Tax=Micrococcaceae TaxID=1268 RepID=UPI00047D42FC|nr:MULTISPECIES: urea amidolyase associated protein UAAP1 [Micrococcaceae]BCW56875.1 urea carboxylase [Arthrobacter sp. StoSoilB20]
MTQTLESAPGTATTTGAKLHARAQHGRTAETMIHIPPTSAPARLTEGLPMEAAGALTWAETLAFGRYTHLELARGTRIRITDLDGDACVHAVIIRSGAQHERINVADTVKVPWQAYITAGHPLLSDAGRLMATVVADSSGKHDALTGTTHLAGNTAKYGAGSAHSASPAGRELLTLGGMKHGVSQRQLPPSISFFKGITVDPDGSIRFVGSAGDGAAVELLLHMDAVLVLANTAHPLDPREEFTGSPVDIVAWQSPQDLEALRDGTLGVDLRPEGRLALHNTESDYNARTSA